MFPFAEPTEGELVILSSSSSGPVLEVVDYVALLRKRNKKQNVVEPRDISYWVPQMLSCELLPGRKGLTGLQLVDPRSQEYKGVKNHFWESLACCGVYEEGDGTDQHRLLSVLRVQAPQQIVQYSNRRAQIVEALASEKGGGKKGGKKAKMLESSLWHGPSSLEALRGILLRGFDRFLSKTSSWGKGVYFTPCLEKAESYSASVYSALDGGVVKVVLLAKVCVGDSCVGSRDLYPPPLKPGTTHHYDSTVNRLEDPSIYVTYKDDQALPMYVCTFLSPE
jgi:poly [ADP-ribose] polymerase 10/14/15